MSFEITEQIQNFINASKKFDRILDVTVEEPTEVMLAQVTEAHDLKATPPLFHFIVTDDGGVPQNIDVIIPFEVLDKVSGPPIDELIMCANRYSKVAPYGIRFVLPDGSDSRPINGHSLAPIEDLDPALESLLEKLKAIPSVSSVSAHKIVDPEIIAKSKYDKPIRIICQIDGLSDFEIRSHEKEGYHHDMCNFIIDKSVYDNELVHEELVANTTDQIERILNKEKLNYEHHTSE